MNIDDLVKKFNPDLTFEELEDFERQEVLMMMKSLQSAEMTVEKIKEHVKAMRESVENELANELDAPVTLFSWLVFLIPIVGMVRKLYHDQKQIQLKARLKNYLLLEGLLTAPEKAKQALENYAVSSKNRKT